MQYKKSILTFLAAILVGAGLYAQGRPSNDTAMTTRIHRLSVRLALSPSQELAFLSVAKQQKMSVDSFRKANLSVVQRKAWLTRMAADSEQQLRGIFSPDQWQNYHSLMIQRREAFIKHAGEQKIKVQATNN